MSDGDTLTYAVILISRSLTDHFTSLGPRKPVDRQMPCCSDTSIRGLWGFNIAKWLVGNASHALRSSIMRKKKEERTKLPFPTEHFTN